MNKRLRSGPFKSCRLLLLLFVLPFVTAPTSGKFQLIGLTQRDWTENVRSTDSDWFYRNTDHSEEDEPKPGGGYYNDLEWEEGRGWQIPAVTYVRGSDIVILLTFVNPGFITRNVTLYVNDAQLYIPAKDPLDDPTIVELSEDGPYSMTLTGFGGTDTATITLTGAANYVARGWLQWDLEAKEGGSTIWDTDGLQTVLEKVYLTDTAPTGLQSIPWTDLLDLSCSWALGESGSANCRHAVTFGLFWDSPWVYDPNSVYFWQEPYAGNGNQDVYFLSDALTSASTVNMDCRDASGFNSLACQSLGALLTCERLYEGSHYTFHTNPLCGMGNDASVDENPYTYQATYVEHDFGFHQVGLSGSSTYDAAAAQLVDLSGASYRNPPAGWALTGYWQTSNGEGGFWGLVYGWPGSPPTAASLDLDNVDRDIDVIR